MEPITLAVTAGIALSSLLFVQDVMAQSYGEPQCLNLQFVEGTGKHPITAFPKVVITNSLNRPMSFGYTFKICAEDGSCGTTFSKNQTIPSGNTYQHTVELFQTVKFDRHGDYHYTVSVDITGDINEHTEKTCGIHIRKND